MKKAIGIIILGLFVSSCGTVVTERTSSGKEYKTFQFKGGKPFSECSYGTSWYNEAENRDIPIEAIADCYSEFKVHKICLQWDYIYEKYVSRDAFRVIKKHREALSEALIIKGKDPLMCRSGDKDARARYEEEIKRAKGRASRAESDANYWRSVAESKQ